ncbi:MAG: hypothetical protein ABIG42_11965 [bacterium]
MNLFDFNITEKDLQNAMVMLGKIDDEIMMGENVTQEKIQEILLAAITTKMVRRNPPGFKINVLEVEGTVNGEPFGILIKGDIKAHLIRDESKRK